MKKLTGALVLSLSLLMASGCRSPGETRAPEDASTPASSTEGNPISAGTTEATKTPIGQEAGGPTGDLKPTLGADLGTGGGKTAGEGTSLSDAERQAQERCVDKFAKDRKLDRYGNTEGTLYAGGTPLFDERTGETRDRLDFFYERQPEAKKTCANAKALDKAPGPDTSPAPKEAAPQKKK